MARVLIVDDDDNIRETVRWLLEDAGYEVDEAASGALALAILQGSAEQLVVLLDYRMPDVNGGDVLRAAADEGLDQRHAFVLLLANLYLLDPETQGRVEAGNIPIITKPFDIDVLLGEVASSATRLDTASSTATAGRLELTGR